MSVVVKVLNVKNGVVSRVEVDILKLQTIRDEDVIFDVVGRVFDKNLREVLNRAKVFNSFLV